VATELDQPPKQTRDLPPWFDAAMIDALADALADRIVSKIPVAQVDPPMNDDTVLDSREAAEYLRLPSTNALHKITARGEIVCEARDRPRQHLRFRKRSLDDYLAGASR
jgi:Helix-turn-helix domain